MGKDYYKILGIDKSATQDEVKRAFRKLAHKHHPDKETGNEAKFKEINEAYQVLGKPEKRQQYDQYGTTFDQQGGFGGGMNWGDFMRQARSGGGGGVKFDFGGLDLGDIFGDMFGFGGGSRSRQQSHGEDIQIDLQISFKDSVFGIKKQVELFKTVKCEHCNGNMAEPGTPIKTCTTCKGQGQVSKVQQTMLGAFQTASVCQECNGEGKKAEKPCTKCSGQGVARKKQSLELEIPAGIEGGSAIRLTGKGNAAPYGGHPGDLYVRVHVKAESRYRRHGNDIHVKESISFVQASLGDKIDVKTLDGELSLKIPAGTQPGTRFRVRDKGVTYLNSPGRGDLYVEVEVQVPKKLSRRQKRLLQELKQED
ncbi:molecular chaperone DnaJ [Candidatus Falkowbacteria bacterium]|jgi:molecular chaperone DnaJ|nr:molecular chaperone DnaJ [Candidatus Falkowbacteria bacterium]MBT5503340.1 molecular chaperone DnaJ [Candidatus Falkowbacteria bacterium]MBT6573671.1 molecular chaperone DnaJ [Candidatus Falkowbacteria bacterium]MBT7500142.1 molecular chaperone DnaJ [Candidatus Falkowbacteria bacterium]